MLFSSIRDGFRDEQGLILPLVLVLLALGVLLIAPTLGQAATGLTAHSVTEDKANELYAADSGIEEALYWLMHDKADNVYWTWDEGTETGNRQPYTINKSTVKVDVETVPSLGENYYKVDSVATGPRGSTHVLSTAYLVPVLQGEINYDGSDVIDGDLYIDGNLGLGDQVEVHGDVYVTGDLDMSGQSQILDGNLTVEGDLTLANQAIVGQEGDETIICIGGDFTVPNGAEIWADLHFLGDTCTLDLTNAGGSQINGNVFADGNLYIDIQENATLDGSVFARGFIDVLIGTEVTGAAKALIDGDDDLGCVLCADDYVYVKLGSAKKADQGCLVGDIYAGHDRGNGDSYTGNVTIAMEWAHGEAVGKTTGDIYAGHDSDSNGLVTVSLQDNPNNFVIGTAYYRTGYLPDPVPAESAATYPSFAPIASPPAWPDPPQPICYAPVEGAAKIVSYEIN